MVEISAKAKKIGGSIYVPIPAHVAKDEGIRDGKTVHFVLVTRERRGKGIVGMLPQAKAFRPTERMWND